MNIFSCFLFCIRVLRKTARNRIICRYRHRYTVKTLNPSRSRRFRSRIDPSSGGQSILRDSSNDKGTSDIMLRQKKGKRPQRVQNADDHTRVMSQMRNQLCGRLFYRRHCSLSVRNYCQVIITPLANLINGRTLSLIHVIRTYPPERRERLVNSRHCVSSRFALLQNRKPTEANGERLDTSYSWRTHRCDCYFGFAAEGMTTVKAV